MRPHGLRRQPQHRAGSDPGGGDGARGAARTGAAFTGTVLTEPMEVIGVPVVEVAHRSDNPPTSSSASARSSREAAPSTESEGFTRLDPAASDDVIRLELDAVADRFATGRRIRLLITGGSFPRSERNLGIDEDPATGTAMEPSHGSTACLWTSLDRCVNDLRLFQPTWLTGRVDLVVGLRSTRRRSRGARLEQRPEGSVRRAAICPGLSRCIRRMRIGR